MLEFAFAVVSVFTYPMYLVVLVGVAGRALILWFRHPSPTQEEAPSIWKLYVLPLVILSVLAFAIAALTTLPVESAVEPPPNLIGLIAVYQVSLFLSVAVTIAWVTFLFLSHRLRHHKRQLLWAMFGGFLAVTLQLARSVVRFSLIKAVDPTGMMSFVDPGEIAWRTLYYLSTIGALITLIRSFWYRSSPYRPIYWIEPLLILVALAYSLFILVGVFPIDDWLELTELGSCLLLLLGLGTLIVVAIVSRTRQKYGESTRP